MELITLDALGTLVGLEPPWPRLVELLRERHETDVSLEHASRALRAEMRYYREHCVNAGDQESLAQLRAECTQIVWRELGEPRIDPAALERTLLDALHFRAYPEVAGALAALRERGIRLVVVSNWDVSLHAVLAQTGLRPLLDHVVTSAETGHVKPAREIFEIALGSVAPSAALHVGDSQAEDVLGAHAAGIEAVLVVREPGPLLAPGAETAAAPPPGVRAISSLAEL